MNFWLQCITMPPQFLLKQLSLKRCTVRIPTNGETWMIFYERTLVEWFIFQTRVQYKLHSKLSQWLQMSSDVIFLFEILKWAIATFSLFLISSLTLRRIDNCLGAFFDNRDTFFQTFKMSRYHCWKFKIHSTWYYHIKCNGRLSNHLTSISNFHSKLKISSFPCSLFMWIPFWRSFNFSQSVWK